MASDDGSSGLPHLALTCFGPPSARVDGGEPAAEVVWRKNLALLIYLAMSGGPRSRDHLLGLFWPDKPQDLARKSLNTAVYFLRAHLGTARLISSADTVELNATDLAVDVLRFEVEMERDPVTAASIPRGPFLEGFTVEDATEFEQWAANQKTRLNSMWASALMRKGESALTESRFAEAREAARRAGELQPLSEGPVDLLIRATAHDGDTNAAVEAFQAFAERLEEAVGSPPNAKLKRLLDRALSGDWRAAPPHHEAEPPLVGRETVHRRAFALVEQVKSGGSRTLVIEGEPGMGKTRLLNECVNRLSLAGAAIEIARPLESDRDVKWSTLRMLMRDGLANAPGVAATDPDALSTLAALVPELAKRFAPEEPRDNAQVASAVASLIEAVAEEQPVGIAVDNAEAADGPTLEVLTAAIRRVRDRPVLLAIATSVSGTSPRRELARLRSEVGRALPGAALRLKPLDEAAMRDLVGHLAEWCQTPEEADRLTRRMFNDTVGSPFFAVTILRALAQSPTMKEDVMRWPKPRQTYESPLPFTMPDLVRMAIVSRLSTVEPGAMDVLRAASVGDTTLDVPLVAHLTGRPEDAVEATLDELEQHNFVSYGDSGYTWVAPFMQQIVEGESLTHGARQRLRRKAVAKLDGRTDLPSRVLRTELLCRIEPDASTLHLALQLAQHALDEQAYRLARRALAVANELVGDGMRKERALIARLRKKIAD